MKKKGRKLKVYAVLNGRVFSKGRAIQEKFNSLCKGPLTGAGRLSDHQRRAHNLAALIFNEQESKIIINPPSDDCDLRPRKMLSWTAQRKFTQKDPSRQVTFLKEVTFKLFIR